VTLVAPMAEGRRGRRPHVVELLELGRPRVVALVLLTAPPVLLAEGASFGQAVGALLATALLASGCSAANAVWERESDARMARTRQRPLPSGRIGVGEATAFASAELGLSLILSSWTGGAVALAVGLATIAVYLGAYTMWLKPRSAWQVPVGALAGAAAPLVADAADGSFSAMGLALFALVAVWQLPHSWAISLFRREDYAAAGMPTLAAVRGERFARWAVVASAAAVVPVSLLPSAFGFVGPVYVLVAGLAGGWFVARALRAALSGARAHDRAAFFASVAHLTVLFAALSLELCLRR
jgi:protoheme IX farnesyltransferase